MATVLIVDDHPTNREFLVTLLGYRGHRLLEASDGAEALALALAERPDLIISDILMPTMDGYEFVHRLRDTPSIADTPVIFSTAHFLSREASALARSCGVTFILNKPCEPEEILRTADAALGLSEVPFQTAVVSAAGSAAGSALESIDVEEFDCEHLRLLTDKLSQKVGALTAVNQKMAALIEVGQQLASEHHPLLLLDEYCRAARVIIGAKCAAVGVMEDDEQKLAHFYACGLGDKTVERIGYPQPDHRVPARLIGDKDSVRLSNLGGDAASVGLPPDFPPVYSFLGVPIMFQARVRGWLCLTNKLGADEFSDEDEDMAATLAAQMAVAYENALLYGEMQDYAGELEVEVAERKRAEEERGRLLVREHEARKKAEEASQAKDAFLTTVSHELREPLNAVLGWARILRTKDLDGATLSYAIGTIERNINTQVQLIEDLLDTSRIENGKLRLSLQPLDLGPVVHAAVDVVRPAADAQSVQLLVTLDSGVTRVIGDPARLQQVVCNLLSNAIKFTPAGGCIAVRLQQVAGHAELAVRDTGRGISSELLPHVFERFTQADDSPASRRGGLGIGLSLVLQLVELHGGSVQAESPGEGQGTVFTMKLPLRNARKTASANVAQTQSVAKVARVRASKKRAGQQTARHRAAGK